MSLGEAYTPNSRLIEQHILDSYVAHWAALVQLQLQVQAGAGARCNGWRCECRKEVMQQGTEPYSCAGRPTGITTKNPTQALIFHSPQLIRENPNGTI